MRRVVVDEWKSLDGVVQVPGIPDEDTTGDFPHGGWHMRYFDEMSQKWVVDYLTESGLSPSPRSRSRRGSLWQS